MCGISTQTGVLLAGDGPCNREQALSVGMGTGRLASWIPGALRAKQRCRERAEDKAGWTRKRDVEGCEGLETLFLALGRGSSGTQRAAGSRWHCKQVSQRRQAFLSPLAACWDKVAEYQKDDRLGAVRG